jgi:arsenite methyltransferase
MNQIHDEVRATYAAAARAAATTASCCEPATSSSGGDGFGEVVGGEVVGGEVFGGALYDGDVRADAPDAAAQASLGCGNPVAVADLREGETVLDLGSGAGLDLILSARRVGPTGLVYGLDMTDEMLDLARANIAEAGVDNVELLHGMIEDVPLPDASADVIISNCVINLAPDKAPVFRELARVLRPGGRVGLTDVIAEDHLSPAERAERGSFVGCIAGALSGAEYRHLLEAAGLTDIEIEPTHAVVDGMWSAIIRATKPA